MKKSPITLKASLLFFAVLIISSCAVNPVTGKRQIMLMSEEQEIQLGFSYDPQVTETFGEYQNDKILNFLQTKTTEMGKISHRPNLRYHIKILDSPVVNAFAVPGGYIYLTRGILAQLNNEAELMGVIGHEMGHITARHSVSQQTKQQLTQLLMIGGMIASEKFARYAEQAFQGMQLLFLKFSRDNEREADALGVEYSSRISYDAHKMADFFQVLNKMNMAESQGGVPTFLSTHPDPGDRYNSVHQSSTEWQTKLGYPAYKVNQENYLQLIDGIVYGEDPRQGFVENNTFYHPGLKFRFNFPGGWGYENTPSQVNMGPADGKALMVFTMTSQKTLQNAADTTLAALGLTLLESKNSTVNGIPARVTISRQSAQDQSGDQQTSNLVLSYFIQHSNVIYIFHGVAAEADFNKYFNTMESSMQTFAKLTDPSKLNVKPTRLLVKRVPATATVSGTLSSLGVARDKLQEIALLNNLELNSTIQAGRLIKVIGQ